MKRGYYPHSDFKKDTYYKKALFSNRLYAARQAGYSVLINLIRLLNNCLQARKDRGQHRIIDIFKAGWEDFKKKKKASELTEDDVKGLEKELQDQTDKRCKDIDTLTAKKEQELLVV